MVKHIAAREQFQYAQVSNFCTGETCAQPPDAKKHEMETACYLTCQPLSPSVLEQPPYSISNGGGQQLPLGTCGLSSSF